ncbi:MAG: hypothetical protein LBP53_02990 [Candidatus Peribacteria bacterium]|jgi:hypothetical protein|nr:hypothetical protein [Candidatus Peribacteria bacterium]
MAQKAQKEGKNLLEVCLEDLEFAELFPKLTEDQQRILKGELERYIGTSLERAEKNIEYAREVI